MRNPFEPEPYILYNYPESSLPKIGDISLLLKGGSIIPKSVHSDYKKKPLTKKQLKHRKRHKS